MKLYYSRGACSLASRIIINELNLKAEYIAVNLATKETEQGEDFFTINPKGVVPTLQLDNGEVLTENAVVLQYLADTAKATELLPLVGDFKRYRVLEWVNYVSTELHKGAGVLFNNNIPQELKDNIFIPMLKKKVSFIDKRLKDSAYLAGDHFTLPDAYFFVVLTWLKKFRFDFVEWPNVSRYFDELQKRKSIVKSLQEEKIELVKA